MTWETYIVADPKIMVGKPVIRGTRLTVEYILGLIAQGWSEAEIVQNFGVAPDQIRACAAYSQERLSSEKVFAVTG